MLSFYAILGLPVSLVVPLLVRRTGNTLVPGLCAVLLYGTGYLALLLWPRRGAGRPAAGVGVDHDRRARPGVLPARAVAHQHPHPHHRGCRRLSGFGQGLGYPAGCAGPPNVGPALSRGHSATGGRRSGHLWLMLGALTVGADDRPAPLHGGREPAVGTTTPPAPRGVVATGSGRGSGCGGVVA